ncbi:MarR family winged helix-turn-helix transcriptional regulator [Pseudonocardia oroxyli]|uniref:MarR family protein n=1 Tax=Pseudonocardia oroxyli TaxID=366584 RepID=A0A1G7KN87_PSEOR|nr:MarR family protein [Pseudonocardia oroxyli]
MHGFALQAVGTGCTAADLGRALGVSKQAAAKTIAGLEAAGYVERSADPGDARRVVVRPTAHGRDLLARSAAIFDALRAEWANRLGEDTSARSRTPSRRSRPRPGSTPRPGSPAERPTRVRPGLRQRPSRGGETLPPPSPDRPGTEHVRRKP